ncbi:S53 family peptidase [Nocardioides sp. URHA0032]|uniref:S53 family peptidase n=1 Tax=Nocardioides sp. URHA0032 TaxID=1380388 RepID=UPI0012DC4009|nr:S53 family peptidase [Nocardioides sp. URHA0032]
MRQLTLAAAAGSAALLATFTATAAPATTVAPLVPLAAQAPESAFTDAAAAADPVACQRPAPDNRVSTTIHCYTPDQIRAFYGLSPLTPSTNDGAGQTIVLVDSYGSPTAAEDLAFFAETFSGPTPDFEAVFPIGKPGYKDPPGNGSGTSGPAAAIGWAGEANLDVQWAYAIAPKAHIVLLATPPAETQGVQGLPNLMKAMDWAVGAYPAGTVFSMSFGTSEEAFASPAAARSAFARFDATFQRGQARHDTFFASSGDDGSLGVGRAHHQGQTLDHPSTSYPNSSPYVTSVGGTQVQSGWTWNPTSDKPFNDDGSRNPAYWAWTPAGSSEAVWNETWGPISTGGGLSSVYARPSFQNGVAGVVGNHRGVPDLAWNAAVNGGVLVFHSYFPKAAGPPLWGVFGGTSASSPQVAALTAIANQGRTALGKPGIGDLNSVIYSSGFAKSTAFTDIVPRVYGTAASGVLDDNQMWEYAADGTVHPGPVAGMPTTPGYDLTTGWGSPKAAGYVSQLIAH